MSSQSASFSTIVSFRAEGYKTPKIIGTLMTEFLDETGFTRLEDESRKLLIGADSIRETDHPYLRHGTYSVHYKDAMEILDSESQRLNGVLDWKKCIEMIRQLAENKQKEITKFEIEVEFSSVPNIDHGQKTSIFILKQLNAKMCSSKLPNQSTSQDYIPNVDLDAIVTEELITATIEESRSSMPVPWLSGSILSAKVVFGEAKKLFAICVWHWHGDMSYLKELIDHGIADSDLPGLLEKLNHITVPEDLSLRLKTLYHQYYPRFAPHEFHSREDSFDLKKLASRIILPLSSGKMLGDGAGAGNGVYEASIEKSQQFFEKCRENILAVKCFREEDRGSFDKELKFFKDLVKPAHRHICTPVYAWTQGGLSYILFPRAKIDLRRFMASTAQPEMVKETALWFLRQIKGIAGAIHSIHDGSESETRSERQEGQAVPRKHGYHHDIKPENMLVYYHSDNYITGDIKLADFGRGKLNEIQGASGHRASPHASHASHRSQFMSSHQSKSIFGTLTYAAPGPPDQKTSRKDDMWAIGCVFTELFEWVFLKPIGKDDKSFLSHLVGPIDSDPALMAQTFWKPTDMRSYAVKPEVSDWLNRVKENKACRDECLETVNLIEGSGKLLDPNRDTRMKASKLYELLKDIPEKAEARLKKNPNHFADNIIETRTDDDFLRPPISQQPRSLPQIDKSPQLDVTRPGTPEIRISTHNSPT